MMMTEETKWGPRIYAPEGGWPNGECPIPGYKPGEYQICENSEGNFYQPIALTTEEVAWKIVLSYRVRADLMSRLAQPAAHDVVDSETRRYRAAVSDPRRMVIAFRAFRRVSARLYASETNCWAAMQVFGLGMTFASQWCKENNIDPDSTDPNATSALAAYAASKEAGR